MNEYIIAGIIGFGSGLILFPIGLSIYVLIKNTKERRKIKRMLKKGKFLITIDTKDYDYKAWEGQKYGNIDREKEKVYLDSLNMKIFKKAVKNNNDFFNKVTNYLIEARKQGYSDEQVKQIFKNKNYSDDLIKQVFENAK